MSFVQQCARVQGQKKTVMVFDAGGVRGIFGLELCRHIARELTVPLSKLCSLVVGTSAGAFLAAIVALGFFDHPDSNDVVANHFYGMLPVVFRDPSKWPPIFRSVYDGTGKREALEKLLGNRTLGEVKIPLMVLSASCSGEVLEFRSWQSDMKHLRIVDVLDASSAAPIFFPPVEVPGYGFCLDGGVRSMTGLVPAVISISDLFGDEVCSIHVLSVGTLFSAKCNIRLADIRQMGLLNWLKHRLFDIILGTKDKTSERLMEKLYGKRFMRIECKSDDVYLDDMTTQSHRRLKQEADQIWHDRGLEIAAFLKPHTIPPT